MLINTIMGKKLNIKMPKSLVTLYIVRPCRLYNLAGGNPA